MGTITQSVGGKLNNININNITTHRGNANGIALFKDSSVEFEKVNIDSIIAGSVLDLNDLRPQQNYLPNKIPKACSIFDNNYNTEYTFSDGIGTNINGFLICDGDELIGDCDDETCIAKYQQSYFDDLAAAASQEQDSLFSSVSDSLHKSSNHIISLVIILSCLIIVIATCSYTKCGKKYKSLNNNQTTISSYNASEKTPLLIN